MCFSLVDSDCHDKRYHWKKKTKEYKAKKKPIIVYKLVEKLSYHSLYRYTSPYKWSYSWTPGVNRSNRGESAEIATYEKSSGRVDFGLHFYVTKRTPKNFIKNKKGYNHLCVIKCSVDPEDVVVVGGQRKHMELVATKATFIEEVK